ncbi:TetR/AcrR family transcriptional regulator [Mycolicibacterium bacteremicum]|uniref:TetR family transcriptional regulator n=1 Tax=Mycolicibacterium bacteremicum TaxID=564198 RepID=A0A1W9Z167_MYCBA|nr:TetR/AcrR family transcriptional regulator [Mycolicibacterium bacteremicum]MCV7432353.1 TetR/AcrR family transcriptional regulator [Mycolicibacterium bacteremicum]ORA06053.1 TetR family transcriptional regulator [Mycolicibacterium bacteremicum]
MSQVRPYRGVAAPQRQADRRRRFLAAGLDLLGGDDDLTVRAICRQAGVATRHFYEAFADKDQFVADVFDSVVGEIAATTQAAVAAVAPAAQNRAGITNLVQIIGEDARVGRLLFDATLTNAVLIRKRAELGGFFAVLAAQHAHEVLPDAGTEQVAAIAHFVVGGVSQTINAWLGGAIDLSRTDLIDLLTLMLDSFPDPRRG